MKVPYQLFYLGTGIFFLWLTLVIPTITGEFFFIDLSSINPDDRVLLQYTTFCFYTASMFMMAMKGDDSI